MKTYKTKNRAIYYRVIQPLAKIGITARIEGRNVVLNVGSYVALLDNREKIDSILSLSGMRFQFITKRNQRPNLETVYYPQNVWDYVTPNVEYVNPDKGNVFNRFFNLFK